MVEVEQMAAEQRVPQETLAGSASVAEEVNTSFEAGEFKARNLKRRERNHVDSRSNGHLQ